MEASRSIHPQEPRWRRLPGERPRQILEAALEVFGERGLAVSRLEDIAKRAGLSKGTIYLLFPEQGRAVSRGRAKHRRQQHRVERAGDSAPWAARPPKCSFARSAAYWIFIRSAKFAPLFRLIHAEIQNFPDLARFYAEEVVSRGLRLIASIIERGIESGEFRRVDPLSAARMLAAPFVIHGLWCTHRDCFSSVATKSDDEVLDELMDFYLHAIRPLPGESVSASM